MKTITEKWFGDHFTKLHPKLQKLHSEGGELNGEVRVEYGTGVAGLLGKRLGKKLGLPQQTESTSLRVVISHTDQEMNWSRQFGSASKPMVSVFKPVGNYDSGYWTETTGGITIALSVAIQQGSWHWIQRTTKIKNITVPVLFLPELKAGKAIEDDSYRFEVALHKRGLGLLVRYAGALAEDK